MIALRLRKNDRENRLRSDDLGSVHTQGTPLFALLQTVLGRRDSFRGPASGADKEASHLFLIVRSLRPRPGTKGRSC